jgi:hypothetical protein
MKRPKTEEVAPRRRFEHLKKQCKSSLIAD